MSDRWDHERGLDPEAWRQWCHGAGRGYCVHRAKATTLPFGFPRHMLPTHCADCARVVSERVLMASVAAALESAEEGD